MTSLRYPGPRPFEYDDKELFFGREKDSERLLTLIKVEKLVVLFSKSGMGKSSLLNARIIPALENLKYECITTRFTNYVKKDKNASLISTDFSPTEKLRFHVKEKFVFTPTYLDSLWGIKKQKSLWHELKNIQITSKEKRIIFLFFDQFEELFTYPSEEVQIFSSHLAELLSPVIPQEYLDCIKRLQNEGKQALKEEDLELLYDPIPIKVLIGIRSDKFSHLTQLKSTVSGIGNKTYELRSLTEEEAKEAITKPASLEGDFSSNKFEFELEACNKIITFLRESENQVVEPFQLQILCSYLENLVIKQREKSTIDKNEKELTLISSNDHLKNISEIFERYYNDLVSSIDKKNELRIKKFIEEGLIFEKDKIRLTLYKNQIKDDYGVDDN
ncbi:MAG TPA: hypothetical protein VJY62_19875, partial [Bacteroidia bacterium]|nr:hypothetical protein [Bacteroidia bacterium]